jgi:restriction system protein
MGPRNRSILASLPWWASVILAIVAYLSLRYWIPSIAFNHDDAFSKDLAMVVATKIAPIIGGAFLIVAALSAFRAWRKGTLLEGQKGIETIRKISWQEFEELVGEAYRRKGYALTETGGGGADGGADLVLRKGGEKLLVQCKHWRMVKVGVMVVRELYGVMTAEGATGGVLISSGTFTQEATEFARGKPLELLDGADLLKVIAEVQKTPKTIEKKLTDCICPLCGSEMVIRKATRGANTGGKFWGCSAYPKCRGIRPYRP